MICSFATGKTCLCIRLMLLACLTLLSSGWTCGALFVSCQGVGSQPQVASLSPASLPREAESVLTVHGSDFTPQSQIMWNGNGLQTAFVDSRHIQTTITQQTFDSFGGSAGDSVQISVKSQGDNFGCPIGGNSTVSVLIIN